MVVENAPIGSECSEPEWMTLFRQCKERPRKAGAPTTSARKQQTRPGLYQLFLRRLSEVPRSAGGIAKFPSVFAKLCRTFSVSKTQCWEILLLLREFGLVEIVPGHGVKIEGTDLRGPRTGLPASRKE